MHVVESQGFVPFAMYAGSPTPGQFHTLVSSQFHLLVLSLADQAAVVSLWPGEISYDGLKGHVMEIFLFRFTDSRFPAPGFS